MNIGDLFVRLGLKKEGFDQGIDSAKRKTNEFGDTLKKIGGAIAGFLAVDKIIEFGKATVAAFNESEQAATRLLTALKGNKEVQGALIQQAKDLQKTTLFEDDETINAMSLVAAFVKEEDTIKRLIPLIQDFAAAKNIDLASAANVVGKSVGSSVNALARYGVEITGAAGSAERAESAIKGLSTLFEGQAAAIARVGTGPLVILKNAWQDVKEEIGGIILQQAEVEGSMTKTATSVFGVLSEKLGAIRGIMKATGGSFFQSLSAYMLSSKKEVADLISLYEKSMPSKTGAEGPKAKSQAEIDAEIKAREDAEKRAEQLKNNYIDLLIIQAKEEQHINDIIGKRSAGMMEGGRGQQTISSSTATPPIAGLAKLDNFYKQLEERTKAAIGENGSVLTIAQQFTDNFNSILESGIQDLAGTFGESLGNVLSNVGDWSDFGKDILGAVGNFMVQFGKLVIAFAVAKSGLDVAIKTPGGWVVALAAGVALVAIGKAISNLSSKGYSGGGGGGSSYSASGYSGPTTDIRSQSDNKVVFEIQGTKLVGVLANTAANKRITG